MSFFQSNQPFTKVILSLCLCLLMLSFVSGCNQTEVPKKISSIDYTVVKGPDIPEDLAALIKERKAEPFSMTYAEKNQLYVVKGFGEQKTGGYSIRIRDFYQAKEEIVFLSELIGPEEDAKVSKKTSYPYIVIKLEYRKDPVLFL